MYNCEDILDKTDDYLDGNLSDFECADFENHLKNCENCKKSVDFARELNNVMHSMPSIEPPKDLLENLHKEIGKSKKISFYKKWQPYSALAACIMLAVVIKSNAVKDLNETSKYLDLSTPVPTAVQQANEPSVQADILLEESVGSVSEPSKAPDGDLNNTPIAAATNTSEPISAASVITPEPTSLSEEKADVSHTENTADAVSHEADYLPQAETSQSEIGIPMPYNEPNVADAPEETAIAGGPAVMSEIQDDIPMVYNKTEVNTNQSDAAIKSSKTSSSSAKGGGAGGGSSLRVNKIGAENKETVMKIINALGISEKQGVYSATESVYDEFVSALEKEGVEFDGIHTYNNGSVSFIIKWI